MRLLGIHRAATQGFWPIADQCVISLGNFLTTILMARALPPAEYGIFALIFGALIVLNTVHGALVVYPVIVSTARTGPISSRQIVTVALVAGVAVSLTLGAAGGLAALWTGRANFFLPALAALVAWQFQETTRTGLVAHLRFREALGGDALSYLGQAASVWAMAHAHHATVNATLLITAGTSTLGAAVQMWQLRLPGRFRLRGLQLLVGRSVRDGRWLLGNRILGVGTGQGFAWALAYRFGPAAVGNFQALINLLAFSHPVLFGVYNAITAAVAGRGHSGRSTLTHTVAPFCTALGFLLVPYFLILLIAPEGAMCFYYGSSSPHLGGAYLLRILVVGYVFFLGIVVSSAILSGVSQTGSLFAAQCAATASTILWGVPMTLQFGLAGAALGVAGVHIVHGTACMTALLRFMQRSPVAVAAAGTGEAS
jgi:O-antigen/teichoic acid export membrane protein